MAESGWARRGSRIQFSRSQVSIILRRDRRTCYLCGGPATQADHVIPIAEGGPNDLSNGRAICTVCHSTKSRAESERGLERRRAKMRLPTDPHPFYGRKKDAG